MSDDEEDDDERLSNHLDQHLMRGGKSDNLGNINRHEEDKAEGLLDEEKMEEEEVIVNGSEPEFVKIIDKSRRAFSFSLDSTKAF